MPTTPNEILLELTLFYLFVLVIGGFFVAVLISKQYWIGLLLTCIGIGAWLLYLAGNKPGYHLKGYGVALCLILCFAGLEQILFGIPSPPEEKNREDQA
jgi:hypothetical protein